MKIGNHPQDLRSMTTQNIPKRRKESAEQKKKKNRDEMTVDNSDNDHAVFSSRCIRPRH